VQEIADLLGKSYNHVWNVINEDKKFPQHRPEAIAEGENLPPRMPLCDDPWPIPPLREELGSAEDPGDTIIEEGVSSLLAVQDANVQLIVDTVSTFLDYVGRSLDSREQISILVLAINRIVWTSLREKGDPS
jgi:hypothetical protein